MLTNLRNFYAKIRTQVERDGYRQSFSFIFLKLINPQSYYRHFICHRFRRNLELPVNAVGIKGLDNYELKIVRQPDELERLKKNGYIFSAGDDILKLDQELLANTVLFLFFKNYVLGHTSFLSVGISPENYKWYLTKTDFIKSGYIGPCYTNPELRGKNIYPHVLVEICRYLKSEGKQTAEIDSRPENPASIKGIQKAGFTFTGIYHFYRFFIFQAWRKEKHP